MLRRLEALHPEGDGVILESLPGTVDSGLPGVNEEEVSITSTLKAVADFPSGSAAGPSGLRPSCLYDLLKRGPHVTALTRALASFVSQCAHGLLPPVVAPFLGAATLIPLRKPDGGVRPIAIGETLRRLVGKCLLNCGPLLAQLKAMAPEQCGVGIPGACESIGQGLQDTVNALPADPGADWVVVQVDLTNAFNSISRQSVLAGTAVGAPAMYAWTRFLYADAPAHLFCKQNHLLSKTGVHQGCPLGPAAFALGIQAAVLSLRSFGLIWSVFYLDDGILVGSLARVSAALSHLKRTFELQGLVMNLSKCTLWGPGVSGVPALPPDAPLRGIPLTPYEVDSGVKVLGVPVGRPGEHGFHEELWRKKVRDLR